MKVIFTADDFGLTYGITKAIRDSYQKGICINISFMANGSAYECAINTVKTTMSHNGACLHLDLTDGKAYEARLAHSKGNYNSFFTLLNNTLNKEK